MRYFPFPREQQWLDTQLILSEVVRRLSEVTGPRRWLRWPMPDSQIRPFAGQIQGNRFAVTFAPDDERLTSPVMLGEVGPGPEGTRIRLIMRPPLWTLVGLVLFWCAGVGFAAVRWNEWRMALVTAVLFLVFPYAVCLLKFKRGCKAGRERLVNLLGCRDEPAERLMTRE